MCDYKVECVLDRCVITKWNVSLWTGVWLQSGVCPYGLVCDYKVECVLMDRCVITKWSVSLWTGV